MPSVTDPLHDSFPEDDRLYRIYWAGELAPPNSGESTHRVRVWLKEVDEFGRVVPNTAIRQITESVGAIPKFVIGSFWRNGRISRLKHENPSSIKLLELVAPEVWSVARAGDSIPREPGHQGSSHTWINRSDLPLIFDTEVGRKILGHNANVVSARTTAGQEIIIPSYEIFRSLFAGTTDLSLALLNGTWDSVEKRFIVGSHQHESKEGVHWSIDLAPGVPPSAVPYLGWLHFSESARKAANRIYPATVRQGPLTHTAWISAEPPIVGQVFRMRARTLYLRSRNALLVTQICSVDFPINVAELSYSIAVRVIPVGTLAERRRSSSCGRNPEVRGNRVPVAPRKGHVPSSGCRYNL